VGRSGVEQGTGKKGGGVSMEGEEGKWEGREGGRDEVEKVTKKSSMKRGVRTQEKEG